MSNPSDRAPLSPSLMTVADLAELAMASSYLVASAIAGQTDDPTRFRVLVRTRFGEHMIAISEAQAYINDHIPMTVAVEVCPWRRAVEVSRP